MASSSGPEQPTGLDPGSVLCDKCKEPVLGPSASTENVSFNDRIHQAMKGWLLSPQMWPVGYLVGSSYSPFRLEQQLPYRSWRNAFEDLLALESGGEMISQESREQERVVAAKLSWERANRCIKKLNAYNIHDAQTMDTVQMILKKKKSAGHPVDPSLVSRLDKDMEGMREMARHRVRLAEAFRSRVEIHRESPASGHKDRGQWIASLITSGAMRGWNSLLEDSEDGALMILNKEVEAPEDSSSIRFSDYELFKHFEQGRPLNHGAPRAPLYMVLRPPPAVLVNEPRILDGSGSLPDFNPLDEPDESALWTHDPKPPRFSCQRTATERITLPNGKTATKVVMKNWLTNDEVEEKVMIDEPGKVLQEVERVRALIQDRLIGFDSLI